MDTNKQFVGFRMDPDDLERWHAARLKTRPRLSLAQFIRVAVEEKILRDTPANADVRHETTKV